MTNKMLYINYISIKIINVLYCLENKTAVIKTSTLTGANTIIYTFLIIGKYCFID